jgi:pimeloyl-ACP methyl ester carboxylesterase
VHSINASASAHEVRPLFDAFRARRRTYAIDLPGYGYSERSDRTYCQGLMVDALLAVISDIRSDNDQSPIDALAVSLSCEFLAKAAIASPGSIRSLALVSPTGFARNSPSRGPPDADCRIPMAYRILTLPLLGRALFALLTSAPSIRFFLRKTWGRKEIDEEMFRTSCRLARYPDAHRAPFHFLSGYLFSADILTTYERLTQPVWLSHGVRGGFTDFSRTDAISRKPNWRMTRFPTGALPYFEIPTTFVDEYEKFLGLAAAGQASDSVDQDEGG